MNDYEKVVYGAQRREEITTTLIIVIPIVLYFIWSTLV